MRRFCSTQQVILTVALLLGAKFSSADEKPSSNKVKVTFEQQWQAKLCVSESTQPQIEFSFHGPITESYGPLCYHFAGYNETCLPAQQRWLTPATTIELIAPGQVPVELLQGYILLVRFPWRSDEVYRYPLADTACRATHRTNYPTRRSNNSS